MARRSTTHLVRVLVVALALASWRKNSEHIRTTKQLDSSPRRTVPQSHWKLRRWSSSTSSWSATSAGTAVATTHCCGIGCCRPRRCRPPCRSRACRSGSSRWSARGQSPDHCERTDLSLVAVVVRAPIEVAEVKLGRLLLKAGLRVQHLLERDRRALEGAEIHVGGREVQVRVPRVDFAVRRRFRAVGQRQRHALVMSGVGGVLRRHGRRAQPARWAVAPGSERTHADVAHEERARSAVASPPQPTPRLLTASEQLVRSSTHCL